METIRIIYDGECPFCSNYVQLLRLRQTAGKVELIDARTELASANITVDAKFDLDEGMLVLANNTTYHGSDAIHFLALLSTKSTLFNRLNRVLFYNATVARLSYPFMKAARNLTLKVLGIKKLNQASNSEM